MKEGKSSRLGIPQAEIPGPSVLVVHLTTDCRPGDIVLNYFLSLAEVYWNIICFEKRDSAYSYPLHQRTVALIPQPGGQLCIAKQPMMILERQKRSIQDRVALKGELTTLKRLTEPGGERPVSKLKGKMEVVSSGRN